MDHFLICDNAHCRFLLDTRVNGVSLRRSQLILAKCPSCGGNWSSACPSCGQALAVKFVKGLPRIACCSGKPAAERKLPDNSAALAASL